MLAIETLDALRRRNPDYCKAYYLIGKYYNDKKYNAAAFQYLEKALTKEITTILERKKIEKYIRKLK